MLVLNKRHTPLTKAMALLKYVSFSLNLAMLACSMSTSLQSSAGKQTMELLVRKQTLDETHLVTFQIDIFNCTCIVTITIVLRNKYDTDILTVGEGEDYVTIIAAFLQRVFISRDTPRMCFNITIIDDILDEGTEEFTVTIAVEATDTIDTPPIIAGNFTIDPVSATIFIIDDDVSPTIFTLPSTTAETSKCVILE